MEYKWNDVSNIYQYLTETNEDTGARSFLVMAGDKPRAMHANLKNMKCSTNTGKAFFYCKVGETLKRGYGVSVCEDTQNTTGQSWASCFR